MRIILWLYVICIVTPVEFVAIPKIFYFVAITIKQIEEPLLFIPLFTILFLLFELLLFIPVLLASEPPTVLGASIVFDIPKHLERQNIKGHTSIENMQKSK